MFGWKKWHSPSLSGQIPCLKNTLVGGGEHINTGILTSITASHLPATFFLIRPLSVLVQVENLQSTHFTQFAMAIFLNVG
jgi:hypothetical protein